MRKDKKVGLIKSIFNDFGQYWAAYGGSSAFFCSPYLWVAFIIAIYIAKFSKNDWTWSSAAVSVLPNMLGFTLGGYAVMLAFGDRRFQNAVRGPNEDGTASPYLFMSASLLHFILFQILGLIVAILCQAIDVNCFVSFIGCWIFIYSILLAIAASFSIFFFSRMYDVMPEDSLDEKKKKSQE